MCWKVKLLRFIYKYNMLIKYYNGNELKSRDKQKKREEKRILHAELGISGMDTKTNIKSIGMLQQIHHCKNEMSGRNVIWTSLNFFCLSAITYSSVQRTKNERNNDYKRPWIIFEQNIYFQFDALWTLNILMNFMICHSLILSMLMLMPNSKTINLNLKVIIAWYEILR